MAITRNGMSKNRCTDVQHCRHLKKMSFSSDKLERGEGIGVRRVDFGRPPSFAISTTTTTTTALAITATPVVATTAAISSASSVPSVSVASSAAGFGDTEAKVDGLLLFAALSALLAKILTSTHDKEVLLNGNLGHLSGELIVDFPHLDRLEVVAVWPSLRCQVFFEGQGVVGFLLLDLLGLIGLLVLDLLALGGVGSLLALDDGSLGALGVVLVGSPVASSAAALLGLLATAGAGATVVRALAIAGGLARSASTLGVAVVVGVVAEVLSTNTYIHGQFHQI